MKLLKLNIQLFASASKSTTLTASSGNKATLTASFNENSTSTNNNTSNITCTATFKMTQGSFAQQYTPKLEIYWYDDNENTNGLLVASKDVTAANRNVEISVSDSKNILHKADGTLNGYAKAVWTKGGGSYVPNSGNVSTENTTLTTIPRATNVPTVNGYVGIPYTITLSPASSSFRHTLRYTLGSLTNQTIATNVTNSYSWTMPTTFYAQIGASATSKNGTLYVDTYSGSTLIGTTSATFYANTIESQAKPNISITSIVDDNKTTKALTGDNSKIVLNASKVIITYSVSSSSNATISSVKVNGVNSTNVPSSGGTGTVTIDKPTTGTFNVVATDGRNYTNSISQTPTYIDYTSLSISSATVQRTAAVTENKATLNIRGNYSAVNFGSQSNALTLTYRVGSGSETALTPTISSGIYTNTTTLTGLYYTQSYTIYITVKDKVNTSGITSTLTLKRGTPIFWADGENFYVEVNFVNRSQESRKKNFEDFDLNAIDVIKKGNIYKFNYDVETDNMKKHYGFVIPDKGGKFIVPKEVLNEKGDSVEYYAMMSILWEAMKQMINKNEELEKEIKALKESDK